MRWSPDGNYLYTGGRRDGEILCWDVRHSSDVVYRCTRASEGTNQRIGQARTIHSLTQHVSLLHSLSTEEANTCHSFIRSRLKRLWAHTVVCTRVVVIGLHTVYAMTVVRGAS